VLDVFLSAVQFMEGAPARRSWHDTAGRNRAIAARAQSGE
jgi:hypothetical protein